MAEYLESYDDYLEKVGGNQAAASFIIECIDLIRVVDDLIDKDVDVPDERITDILYGVFGKISYNQFYRENMDALLPLILIMLLNYEFSNRREKEFIAKVRSQGKATKEDTAALMFPFVLRNGDYNLVNHVVTMCRGLDYGREQAGQLWGALAEAESFEDYCADLVAKASKSE